MKKQVSFRGGLPELLRQARGIQEKLNKVKEELKSRVEEVSIAGGKIRISVNGERRVESIKIDPAILKDEDISMVEDLVKSGINAALEKMDEIIEAETGKITEGFDIPGLF